MTDRELRLRERIDTLIDERDLLTEKNARLRKRLSGRRIGSCVYCSAATPNRACASHRDLLTVDPVYA